MTSIERRVLETIKPVELRELAALARAVPKQLLSSGSPNAAKFERMARILEDLAKLDALPDNDRNTP